MIKPLCPICNKALHDGTPLEDILVYKDGVQVPGRYQAHQHCVKTADE